MKVSLRTLLVSVASIAIVVVTLGDLALNVKGRIAAAEFRLAAQNQRLTSAGAPLLLNALVGGDLSSAEQTLRNLNLDLVWGEVRLYESDGRTLILDASPANPPRSDAPGWLKRVLALDLKESRIPIVADPVVYGVLAVTPSSESLESELWRETRTAVMITAVLLTTSLVVMTLIVTYGLRPIRALGESAARLGSGDLSVRMPETNLVEVASAVHAFNTMASNLEQVLAELRTKETTHRRLAAIVEQSEEAILTIDLEHRTTSWNMGARQLFGYTSEEMLGQSIGRLFVAATDAHLEEQILHLSETHPPSRVETALVRSSGLPVMVAASASPLSGDDGAHIGHIILARDITEAKRVDGELRWAKEQAEAGNRAKAEFVATMSHEIRTPMNGIIGMTDLMLDTDMTPEQREYVNLVGEAPYSRRRS